MLSRAAKSLFYSVAGPLMYANAALFRMFRAPRSGFHRVHLGPGQRHYIPDWINVDANMFTAKCDVWADLRNPLPFRSSTIDCFYSHHVIEHLPDLREHFRDVYRCLKPRGVYRFGGPNGDSAIQAFVDNNAGWFSDFPDSRTSLGGRFDNFILCRNEHLAILTESYMREILESVGFVEITKHLPTNGTNFPELFAECLVSEHEDNMELPHTLIMEAVRT